MAEVIITEGLRQEILKKFKGDSKKIFNLMYSLKENPKKGKLLGQIRGILIKEIKYENFRIYFITNGFEIKFLKRNDLKNLTIKFIKMSDKKSQQKTIDGIKDVLRKLGNEGF
ncbi:hypothetical protein COU53_01535 [Candidatus Pacearchaeota archaeon CG10_big_fil_rev_8_21_14_0_10_30_48]|nr:MAG: hypothetical protein COU53_01535 [Candidatus Pacearchaeota archaeon CG10_big_fil_rev_8_21_14_0_10_30_48]